MRKNKKLSSAGLLLLSCTALVAQDDMERSLKWIKSLLGGVLNIVRFISMISIKLGTF
ncbi:hypothetical protein [Autumnicola musiva]|uniref:Uncharacterized protein n=1 Tax=Autumnicola musiva TaxID=3075589 RepID=A0ABU3DAJ9_9FLAO|nr:hypothetical protein [Zunongwangia sp. F117]MDT0678548.1 hypothetical protein [Zunongwangia sp. F117]